MIPGNTSSQGKFSDAPTSVSASAGNGQATVSFTLPVYDGKGVATYVATSSPSGLTGSGASSPITVTGLANGTAYTFTVTTVTGYGVSGVSGASGSVTPVAPPYFPPYFPPSFPPPPVCGACAWDGVTYSCIGQQSFEYVTCGAAGCPGEGGQNPAYRNGICGYVTPPPVDPCASVNCATYNSSPPPGGVWTGGPTPNDQSWDPHCPNAGFGYVEYACAGYGGESYWEGYTSSDGCCAFNLFITCLCN